ncbi:inositol hexakisphosphate and diphosphoinositol-pentakisphosphate kinase isoform X2 [Anoplophora glabripennis]|uniref:inositol hexakisphosphate and diphosphoinositol-pentakisphosphate kinase isoform X2 n=1 Tax=Anoplophora glabripennis TaxID=217634 RepID=UPI000873A99E|nr:inositol hexakisphosphate and diphosphoinositol-pentakisphosphate kinase isoform X2 [Anoplophora glabripennis]
MEWTWLKDWWRLKKWRKYRRASETESFCFCDECLGNDGDLELCDPSDISLSPQDMDDDGGKVVIVGVCAMEKKTQSKPMKEILTRLQEFEYIKVIVFQEEVILQKPVEEWPVCDCLISFHSKGFPLDKAIQYAQLHNPYVINNLHMQYDIQDRRKVYATLESEGIEIPRYAVLDRDSLDPKDHELVESEDHVEVNGVIFNKPFVEKPVSAEDHNIYIYYPTSAGGGSQRLFRKIGSRSSVYSPESRVRKTGSFIYEDFMPTDGTDVKVYTVGPDYAHAEARKSPALDGKVERDRDGKEIRYPVILSNAEKLISRKVCLAFKQAVCGFDLLRASGKSFVCDVNGFSFVKNSNKYYDDCAKILGNMILRELAPTLHIPWSVPFQLDDPPIVPTTFGKMMELRCVVAVIRHGDRTPKQKMKVEVRHPKFFEIFEKYDGYKHGHVKLKRPKQLQEILDIARSLLAEIQQHEADPEIEEKQGKLEQLKAVLEMYGHFSGINRKVQMKYQPKGRPRGSSSDDVDKPAEPSLVLILKWGGELTPAGRIQAEELGRIFRCMYPGGQGRHLTGEYAGAQGLGLLRLHSTFRHDLKIYASDEGRVQMTAAAFAKGLLALEGELTPILVQMVKSANTNGLLDNDCDSSKYQNMCKALLHELMQLDRDFSPEDREKINPCNSLSISDALDFVKNPVKCCKHVHELIKNLMEIVQIKKEDLKTKDAILYHGETWELMGRRWGKIEKDFYTKNKTFDISKIPDIYDCIKYDLQHNQHTLQFEQAEELYTYAKYLADIVIPQEYGLTAQEKLTIGQGICTPLLKKIKADLQRNIEESGEETVNRLNPRYSHGVSSPGRHVRTRLYFTSESHIHSLITVLRHGGLLDVRKDEQWRRAMEYVSMVSELNYMSQIVIMLYEDPTKDPCSEERFHIELHFSPGVNCCVQKNLPPGPGFRPHSRNESAASKNSSLNTSATATPEETKSQCSPRIDEEGEIAVEEERLILDPPRVLESPPSNNGFTPPDSPDTTYRHYLKTSDPIPIGSSHTVSGHEAMHLAKRLNEELANQAAQQGGRSFRINRSTSPEPEPRSRSYDHKSPQKSKAEKLHQSLDAVNSQDIDPPNSTDLSVTPINTPTTPPTEVPVRMINQDDFHILDVKKYDFTPISNVEKSELSPISGSFDFDFTSDVDSPLTIGNSKPFKKLSEGEVEVDNNKSQPKSSTNELPLTELNLALFTSELETKSSCKMSTNELPLSDIKFISQSCKLSKQNTLDSQNDDTSLEVNWDTDIKEIDEKPKFLSEKRHRSFSDPNILDSEWVNHSEKYFLLEKYNESLARENFLNNSNNLSPPIGSPCLPYSFYPEHAPEATCLLCTPRTPSTLLSFFTSPPRRLNTSRYLSHPAPSVTPCMSNSECGQTVKRHRHSIAGQMSYFKMLGFGCGGPIGFKKLVGGSTNSLFSTAVISGSSSAPNLRDMISNTSSATAIEGFGGVPPIRPLETLHNALSLKQIDTFLDGMTAAPLFRTPSSTPPKHPSTPLPTNGSSLPAGGLASTKSQSFKLQSPSNSVGWSGSSSLMSSSGPSSPGYSENSKGSSSEMSSSIISGDGLTVDNLTKIFPTAPGLDQDLGSVGMLLDSFDKDISGSMEFSEYYNSAQKTQGGESGDVTPVSGGSELEFNTNDATAGSSSAVDYDVTVTEDMETIVTLEDDETIDPNETLTGSRLNALSSIFSSSASLTDNNQQLVGISPKLISPMNPNVNICTNVLHSPSSSSYNLKHIENTDRIQPCSSGISADFDRRDLKDIIRKSNRSFEKDIPNLNINISSPGSDKWSTNKEKFLEIKSYNKTDNIDFGKNLNISTDKKVEKESGLIKPKPGAVVVRESYIEPPRISRVSKSFHGKSPSGKIPIDITNIPRRASDGVTSPGKNSNPSLNQEGQSSVKLKNYSEKSSSLKRPQFVSQLSQPCGTSTKLSSQPRKSSLSESVKTPRFTTTRVDEAEHAASVGIPFVPRVSSDLQDATRNLSAALDSDGASTSVVGHSRSVKNKSISCDFSDSNVKVTKSNSDKSSVTHGFNVDKKD